MKNLKSVLAEVKRVKCDIMEATSGIRGNRIDVSDLKAIISETREYSKAKKVKIYTYDDDFNDKLIYSNDYVRGIGMNDNGEMWALEASSGSFPDSDTLNFLVYDFDGVNVYIDGKHLNPEKVKTYKVKGSDLDRRIDKIKWFNKFVPYRKKHYSNS